MTPEHDDPFSATEHDVYGAEPTRDPELVAQINALRALPGNFAHSLCRQFDAGRDLSAKQLGWVDRLTADPCPTEKAPYAALKARAPIWACTPEGDTLTIKAPRNGRDVLYLVVNGGYIGKVTPDNALSPLRTIRPALVASIAQLLPRIARDPRAYAEGYGKKTGQCGMCGRKLTDPESIRRGTGPVCDGRWDKEHG